MNKVTQSIYKKKVEELENKVIELLNKPQPHLYIVAFGGTPYQEVQFYIHTAEEIPLTASDIYDYILEATKYHGTTRYNIPVTGRFRDTVTTSETYGLWLAVDVGARQNYPSQSVTDITIIFVKTGEPNGTMTRKITKQAFISMNVYINKVY